MKCFDKLAHCVCSVVLALSSRCIQKKRPHTSSVFEAHVRKTPKVSIADGESDASEQEFNFLSPLLSLNRLWFDHSNTGSQQLRPQHYHSGYAPKWEALEQLPLKERCELSFNRFAPTKEKPRQFELNYHFPFNFKTHKRMFLNSVLSLFTFGNRHRKTEFEFHFHSKFHMQASQLAFKFSFKTFVFP